jgi:hypothetical protein
VRIKFVVAIGAVIVAAVVIVLVPTAARPRTAVALPAMLTIPRLTPAEAVVQARKVEVNWEAHLKAGARAAPAKRFPNPSIATLRARLQRLSRQYHFSIASLRIVRPMQDAPLVIVQSGHKPALSAATRLILRVLDPKQRTNDDRTGWHYEGFFFEAEDPNGIPFLATFNWWRGPVVGGRAVGGRSDSLPLPSRVEHSSQPRMSLA